MKKIFTLATAAFLLTGVAFASGGGKTCGKDEKGCTKACCKKDTKATKAATKATVKEAKPAAKKA